MRTFPILAAALFLAWTPALAAESPRAGEQTALGHEVQQQAAPSQDRRDIMEDIMTRMLLEEMREANPYGNPGPSLISDGWAQRT